jgi:hypothetical protein
LDEKLPLYHESNQPVQRIVVGSFVSSSDRFVGFGQ